MSTPTARELLDDLCSGKECGCVESQLAARVEAVLALHTKGKRREWTDEDGCPRRGGFVCSCCREAWPCPTVRLLNEEKL